MPRGLGLGCRAVSGFRGLGDGWGSDFFRRDRPWGHCRLVWQRTDNAVTLGRRFRKRGAVVERVDGGGFGTISGLQGFGVSVSGVAKDLSGRDRRAGRCQLQPGSARRVYGLGLRVSG